MSKNLTIDADNLAEALKKAQATLEEPVPFKELTPTRIYYDEFAPVKWMNDKKKCAS